MLASSLDGFLSFGATLPTTPLAVSVTVISGGKSDAWSWAIVLFCVILGLLVSLNPSRRTYEIKRTKDE